MKKKSSSLLDRMASAGMAKMPPPTIHLRGKHAKAFHGMKPGQKVSAHMRGTLQGTGLDRFNNNEPTADIALSHVVPKGGKVPADETEPAGKEEME